jgi:hypothetical protein
MQGVPLNQTQLEEWEHQLLVTDTYMTHLEDWFMTELINRAQDDWRVPGLSSVMVETHWGFLQRRARDREVHQALFHPGGEDSGSEASEALSDAESDPWAEVAAQERQEARMEAAMEQAAQEQEEQEEMAAQEARHNGLELQQMEEHPLADLEEAMPTEVPEMQEPLLLPMRERVRTSTVYSNLLVRYRHFD